MTPDCPVLIVVVPTSDRASLAIAACRALLAQRGLRHEVLVSDNSTRPEEAESLTAFVRACGDPRLIHVRPAHPLTMPSHWDWALEQAMQRSTASHLMLHYDRKITKPGALRRLCDIAAQWPDRLVAFAADHVSDRPAPYTLWQTPWTGRVYEIETSKVIELTTRCMIEELGHAWPILSNCLIPRDLLVAIRNRFDSICDSTGPDSCFAYRFCALYDRYLFLDRATAVIYACQRSNGLGYLRGTGGDFKNFTAAWGDRAWLDAAPIPGLNLGQNMLYHEYEVVRRSVESDRLPPVDRASYLVRLESALAWVKDADARQHARRVLEQHGLPVRSAIVADAIPRPADAPDSRSRSARWFSAASFRRLASVIRSRLLALRRRQNVVLLLARYFRVEPEHITGFTFGSDDEAVRHALEIPRRRDAVNPYLEPLLPREVASGSER